VAPLEESKEGNRMIQFFKQYADTWLKFDLLLFWCKHPYAKFTSGTIARTLDRKRRVEVEEALDCFVHQEIVEKHTQQGLPFYGLTADPDKRRFVLNIPAYRSVLRPALSLR
jgi:hypothetical protein